MYTLCWSPKGGSGTTVVAASLALLSARERPTILLDLGGDAPAALGLGEAGQTGVADWLDAPHADAASLHHLAVPAGDGLGVIGRGTPSTGSQHIDVSGWERLVAACASTEIEVVIDAGPELPSRVAHQQAAQSLLVIRPCYLALRRAVQCDEAPTGIIVIGEPGRALGVGDVARALSSQVVAEIAWDPAVARAVDAGLLGSRLPQSLSRPLRRVAIGAAA